MNFLKQGSSQQKGFTLLEVIVAITILGTGMVIVIGLFSGGLRSAILSKDYSIALLLAQKKINEIDLKNAYSNSSGTFESKGYEFYKWKFIIEDYPFKFDKISKITPKVIKAKIIVFWKDGKKDKKIELTTLKTLL